MKKTKSLIFSVFSIFLLLSIGLNPISSNPNTGLFPLAYALVDPVIDTERAGNYLIEKHVSGKNVHIIGLPNLVQDNNGKWIDAVVTEDANFVHINSRTPSYISKSDCKLHLLDFDTKSSIVETHYGKWQKGIDNKGIMEWSNFDISELPCDSVKSYNNATGSFIEYVQKNEFMELTTIIAFYTEQHNPESFIIPKLLKFADISNKTLNSLQVPEITDKFRITHVVESQTDKVTIDDKTFLTEQTVIKEEKPDGTKLNLFEEQQTDVTIEKPIIETDYGDEIRVTDYTKEKERLSEIKITNEQNKVITEAVFEKDGFVLQEGESKVYDPTFSSNNPIEDGTVSRGTGTGTSCTGASYTKTTSATLITAETDPSGNNASCYRLYVETATTSIPSNAVIIDVDATIDVETKGGTTKNCDIYPMSTQPSSASAQTVYDDIASGTPYVSNDSFCQTLSNSVSLDLGSSADTDLQNLLGSGWFAWGLKFNDETRDGNTNYIQLASEENASPVPAPTLTVTYVLPVVPSARTSLSVGSATASTLTASWTNPTNFDNSSQPAITSQTLYRGNWGYPNTALSNSNGSDSGSLTGSIDMSALGNKLLYHFDYLNSANGIGDNSGSGKNGTVMNVGSTVSSDTFASSSGWTQTGSTVSIAGGDVDLVSKTSGGNDNIHRDTFGTLTTTFSMNFDIIITARTTNCFIPILSVSDATTNPMASSNDIITLAWHSHTGSLDGFVLEWADGSTTYSVGTADGYGDLSTQYYTTLERTSATQIKYYIYTDSGRTTQISGSPITETIPSGITALDNLFIGGGYVPQAGCTLSGNIDNVVVTNNGHAIASSHTHKTGEVNQAIPFSTSVYGNFTHSSSPMRSTNDWTFATSVYKNNTNPFTVVSWADSSSNDFAIKLDDDSIALTKESTEMLNKTFSTNLGTDKWSHIAITKSGSTICAYVNGTLVSTCATNSTSLSTPSNNMYYINKNADADTGLGIWMADEFVIFNTALSATNIDNLFDHTQSFTRIVTGITSNATSQQDTGLSASTTYCYYVTATNSVGESSVSNVDCEATSASSGGGDEGSGGGGSSGGSSGSSGQDLNKGPQLLEYSLTSFGLTSQLGTTIPGTITLEWNDGNDVQVSSIQFEDYDLTLSFGKQTPFTLTGSKGDQSSDKIPFTVKIPEKYCSDQVTFNCAKKSSYALDVRFEIVRNGQSFLKQVQIPVTIGEPFNLALVTVTALVGIAGLGIYNTIRRQNRNSRPKKESSKHKKHEFDDVLKAKKTINRIERKYFK